MCPRSAGALPGPALSTTAGSCVGGDQHYSISRSLLSTQRLQRVNIQYRTVDWGEWSAPCSRPHTFDWDFDWDVGSGAGGGGSAVLCALPGLRGRVRRGRSLQQLYGCGTGVPLQPRPPGDPRATRRYAAADHAAAAVGVLLGAGKTTAGGSICRISTPCTMQYTGIQNDDFEGI